MQHGDIDNTPSPRWLITLEALTGGAPVPAKKWRNTWAQIASETPIERQVLGRLWQFTDHTACRFELVTFGLPTEYTDALLQRLDEMGVHPIFLATPYEDRKALQNELAYRPDVQGVVDTREGVLWWGVRGREVVNLLGLRLG